MRFLFFLFGLPIMIMSFFEVADVVPLSQQTSLWVDGNVIELTQAEQDDLAQNVLQLFEDSRTVPAYGVIFHNEFCDAVQEGTFVSLFFGVPISVNGLTFDQLVFQLSCDAQGFDVYRGNHGIFQGRCLHVDLGENTMQALCDFVDTLDLSNGTPLFEVEAPNESEDGESEIDEFDENQSEDAQENDNEENNQTDETDENNENNENNAIEEIDEGESPENDETDENGELEEVA